MGIKRTVEWKLTCLPAQADERVRQAFSKLGLSPEGPPGVIRGVAKRAILKNRWAAAVDVTIEPMSSGCAAVCQVDMAGNKHFEVLGDLAEAVGDDIFDDRGVGDAAQRLGKASRIFGRKEMRHLRNLLYASETVQELGQGQYGDKQGLVVLTTGRLFFFEKSLGSETTEEFSLASISSLTVSKKMTGERLQIHASGNSSEIKGMMHGQADALSRAFRKLKDAAATPLIAAATPADDPVAKLEQLASLRDKGILSDAEFDSKKSEILDRL